jgi:hypothetical protein
MLAADRLASNGVRAASVPRQLVEVLSAIPAGSAGDVAAGLEVAAAGAAGYTDLYRPSPDVLAALAAKLANGN